MESFSDTKFGAGASSVGRTTWTVSRFFAGGSFATYALLDVPLGTVSLSAKTDGNLRHILDVSFSINAAALGLRLLAQLYEGSM